LGQDVKGGSFKSLRKVLDLLVNFEIAVFEYLNYLLVLICFLFDLINEPASLDSEDVKQAFHHVAVELVGHGPCALNKHFRARKTRTQDLHRPGPKLRPLYLCPQKP